MIRILFLMMPLLFLAGNAYIFWQGGQAARGLPPGARVALSVLFWVGALSLFWGFALRGRDVPAALARVVSTVGTGWLVFTLYMTLALALFELARLINRPCPYAFPLSLLLTLSLLGYGYYKYLHPSTRVINLVINKPAETGGKPLRVVAVSDLHLGYATGKEMLAEYVRRINAERPDLVLIGGDLIDSDVEPLYRARMEEELARIHAPLGVYMAPGNHEYISGIEASARFIAGTPITLLRDSVARLPGGIQLVGRDDRSNPRRQAPGRLMAGLDKGRPIIVIDHQPYELAETAAAGADLRFSGHTHRGQVWPLSWIVDRTFELSYGSRRIGDCLVYVSSGLSLWGPPFRIGTESELVVFDITFGTDPREGGSR